MFRWLINILLFWRLVLFRWFFFLFWWIWLESFFQIFLFISIFKWFVFFWFLTFSILDIFTRINHLNSWVWWLNAGILWSSRDRIILLRNFLSLIIWNIWAGDWKIMLGQIFKIWFFVWWRVRLEVEVKYIWFFFFLLHLLALFFFWRIFTIFLWKLTLITLICHHLFTHVLWLIKYLDKMFLFWVGFLHIPVCWFSELNTWYLLEA